MYAKWDSFRDEDEDVVASSPQIAFASDVAAASASVTAAQQQAAASDGSLKVGACSLAAVTRHC